MFFYGIFHRTVHQAGKKTADHGNGKDNSNFDSFAYFAETADKQAHGDTDETSEKRNKKHFSYLSLKVKFQNISQINKQNDNIYIADQERGNLLG